MMHIACKNVHNTYIKRDCLNHSTFFLTFLSQFVALSFSWNFVYIKYNNYNQFQKDTKNKYKEKKTKK